MELQSHIYGKIIYRNWLVVSGLLLAIVLGIGIVFDLRIVSVIFAVIIGVIFLLKAIDNPFPILLLLVILRPSMEAITNLRIEGIGIQMLSSILLLLAVIVFFYQKRKFHYILSDKLAIFFIIYLTLNIVSFYLNEKLNILSSLSMIFRFSTYIAIYAVCGLINFDKKKVEIIFVCLLLSLIIPNITGCYQLVNHLGLDARGVLGIYGTFSHPNMYANYLALTTTIILYYVLKTKFNLFYVFILMLNLILCIKCYGRAALAAAFIPFFLFGIIKSRKLFLFVALMVLVGLFYMPIVFPDWYQGWYHRFVEINFNRTEFLSGRNLIWSRALMVFKQHYLIGIGPSLFYPYYYHYAVHNELLRNVVEVGVVGTVPFLIFWSILLYKVFLMVFRNVSNINIVLFSLTIQIIWLSLTSNLITSAEVLWAFWFLFGAILSYNISQNNVCKKLK